MKKMALILTVIGLIFLMTACQSSAPEQNDADVVKAAEVDGNIDGGSHSEDGEEADGEAAPEANGDSQGTDGGSVNEDKANVETEQDHGGETDGRVREPAEKPDKPSEVRDADGRPLTKKEAEELVRNHLDLTNRPEVKVQYDHEEQGRYVIHVYEIVGEGEASHTATLGWYYVNPKTQEIESMF